MATTISPSRMWLAIALLVAIAAVFVMAGMFEQARPLLESSDRVGPARRSVDRHPVRGHARTGEPDPLTRAEWLNVVFILAATQIAQILMVAIIALFSSAGADRRQDCSSST